MFDERIGGMVQQDQLQFVGTMPQQQEHRDHPALGGEPGVPLPVAIGQLQHVVGELGLRKRGRVRAFQRDHGMVGQCKTGGEVVSHEGED